MDRIEFVSMVYELLSSDSDDSRANKIIYAFDECIERKDTLLKATHELLSKQDESAFILNLLTETVHYDDADCDGYCLMNDIDIEINLDLGN